jgi:hypothetical protein
MGKALRIVNAARLPASSCGHVTEHNAWSYCVSQLPLRRYAKPCWARRSPPPGVPPGKGCNNAERGLAYRPEG